MKTRKITGAHLYAAVAVMMALTASGGVFAQEHIHGTFVSFLPQSHRTIMFGGVPYYYANHTYYIWNGEQKKYEVVAPPPGYESAKTGEPAADGQLYVFARNDVSPDQQLNDRYECDNSATEKTGYDLTKEDGGLPPDIAPRKRADYFRAEAACLQARGYHVR